jgi:hypothetical protein
MQIENLIELYKPYFYFHRDEQYAPISLDQYLLSSRLYENGTGAKYTPPAIYMTDRDDYDKRSELKGAIIYKDVGEISTINPLDNDDRILFANRNVALDYTGRYNNPRQINLRHVPIYVTIDKFSDYTDIVYYYFFTYNAAYRINIPFTDKCVSIGGNHHYDCEHIRIRINNNNSGILGIFYSAHSPDQGSWIKPYNIEYMERTHPIVYIARGSHASYPQPGIYLRICCAANDITSRDIQWIPDSIIALDNSEWIRIFRGNMSIDGGLNIYEKINSDKNRVPNIDYRAGPFYRCFLLPLNFIKKIWKK